MNACTKFERILLRRYLKRKGDLPGWGSNGHLLYECCVFWFYSNRYFLFLQTRWLWTLRDSLWSRGLSSEVRPLTSNRTGSDWKQAGGIRSEAAVFWTGESKLSTGDSEVLKSFSNLLSYSVIIYLNCHSSALRTVPQSSVTHPACQSCPPHQHNSIPLHSPAPEH